jgi:hypothetical protein
MSVQLETTLIRDRIDRAVDRRPSILNNSGLAPVSPGGVIIGAVTAVLAVGSILAGWAELALSICSIGVISLFVRWLLKRGHLPIAFLLVAFLLGYLVSWCIGFLGYRYMLPWRGFAADILGRHWVVTATIVLLAASGTCVGGWIAVHLVSPVRKTVLFCGFPMQQLWPHLVIFGVTFLAYQIITLSVIGLNARWELGSSLAVGSEAYWVAGFRTSLLAFYALMGLSLRRPLWSARNWWVGGIIAVSIGLNGLTGGRSFAFEPFLVCAAGAMFSSIGSRALVRSCVLATPMLIALMLVVGWVRDSPAGFAGGSVKDKFGAIAHLLREGPPETSAYGDPTYLFFSRLFESSAQDVIDDVTESRAYVGWLDFDRVLLVFVPQFIYPEKLPLNDGQERLVSLHGYQYSGYTASPLTILADAYERFGAAGVAGFHVAAGMFLVLIGRLLLSARRELLGVILLVCFARAALSLYSTSVLQFVSATLYGSVRDGLVISGLFAVGLGMQHFLGYLFSGSDHVRDMI